MSQMIQCLSDETVNNLYPPSAFPIEVRHFLADWIESQRWYDKHARTHILDIHICIHVRINRYTNLLAYIQCMHAYSDSILSVLIRGLVCLYPYACVYLYMHLLYMRVHGCVCVCVCVFTGTTL